MATEDDPAPRVALVMCSPELAEAVSRRLESEGVAVVATLPATADGAEALPHLEANVALIESSGTIAETAALLRRIQEFTALPMLVLGAPTATDDLVELIEAGCCGCVPREASPRELAGALARVLRLGLDVAR